MSDQEQELGMISLRLGITGIVLPMVLAILFLAVQEMKMLGSAKPYYGLCALLFLTVELLALGTGRASRGTLSGRIGVRIGAWSLALSAVMFVAAAVWCARGTEPSAPGRPATCDKASDPTAAMYYFNVARAGWDTVIYINGNPACRAGSAASVVQEMSPWMKTGSNSIRIVAKRCGDHASDCDIRFVKVTDTTDPNSGETLNGIHRSPATADQYEVEFEVAVSRSPATWLWQRADRLEVFTDADRAGIAELVNGAANALTRKNSRDYTERTTPVWGAGPLPAGLNPTGTGPDEQKKALETMETICSYPDLAVVVAPQTEWEYLVGKRVVMVCRAPVSDPGINNCILYAGHAPDYWATSGEMIRSISAEALHFLKVDGKWAMLAP